MNVTPAGEIPLKKSLLYLVQMFGGTYWKNKQQTKLN